MNMRCVIFNHDVLNTSSKHPFNIFSMFSHVVKFSWFSDGPPVISLFDSYFVTTFSRCFRVTTVRKQTCLIFGMVFSHQSVKNKVNQKFRKY